MKHGYQIMKISMHDCRFCKIICENFITFFTSDAFHVPHKIMDSKLALQQNLTRKMLVFLELEQHRRRSTSRRRRRPMMSRCFCLLTFLSTLYL